MLPFFRNKFIVLNLLALIFIKLVFSYSAPEFASLIVGLSNFTKEDVVTQTNQFRKASGVGELKENSVLDLAAQQKLQDMIQNQYFAHTSPVGVSPWHWIEINKYKYSYAGENLAIGFVTAKDTVSAWVNSPAHRANLVNSNYKEIGVAVAQTKIQDSEGYLVVQLFGTPKPTPATTPVSTTKPKPAPTKIVTPSPTKKPELKPTQTLIVPPPLQIPKPLSETPIISKVSQASAWFTSVGLLLDQSFVFYAFVIFIMSVLMLVFKGLKRELVLRSVTGLAILILAVAIPVFQITRIALIL